MAPSTEWHFTDTELITKLSLAISLIDDYTKKQPLGTVNVSLEDTKYKPVRNPSGYYAFLDLPDDTYTVQVRSDFYFDEDVKAKPSSLNRLNPVVDVDLKPNPTYPFPYGATLIRGIVLDSNGTAVPNADLRVKGKDIKTKTSEKGEFVVYFRPLKEDEIIKEDGTRFVKGNGDKKVHLEVIHPTGTGGVNVEVAEGNTATVKTLMLNT